MNAKQLIDRARTTKTTVANAAPSVTDSHDHAHDAPSAVDSAVELAESRGYAVANVSAPLSAVPGLHIRLEGKAAPAYAARLAEWADSIGWPATIVTGRLAESTESAMRRAHKARRLTPMLQCLLRASDEMWRYENVIVPALKSGKIVFEVAPCTDTHCEGIPVDVHAEIMRRLPTPVSLTVGDDLNKLRWAKDAVECLKSAP